MGGTGLGGREGDGQGTHVQQGAGCVGAQHSRKGAQAPRGLEHICGAAKHPGVTVPHNHPCVPHNPSLCAPQLPLCAPQLPIAALV